MAWRYTLSETSPQAKTPAREVWVLVPLVRTYPAWSGLNSTMPSRNDVAGVCPMATNSASASITLSSSVYTSRSLAPLTTICTGASRSTSSPSSASSSSLALPRTSTRTVFHRMLIDGCSMTLCARIFDARNSSRLCTTVTLPDVLARTSASSMAVSPPPTTITSLPRYMCPSHVAQLDTPPPLISYSPLTPSQLLSAPVATTTACVSMTDEFVRTLSGRSLASTSTTVSASNVAPNSIACCLMRLTTAGPVTLNRPG
mmetsp:Transcript_31153/g.74277  ORF Transcript_31153/g.74277 Transcript_31153/m.74277 type:complete len:258 (-) Transcript_31153:42-815(-)